MAEGQTRLNQQVVDTYHWEPTDRPMPHRPLPSSLKDPHDRERRLDGIRRAIQAEIIPRVAVGHGALPLPPTGNGIDQDDVARLVHILLHADETSASDHVQSVLARGVAPDHLYLHLFQAAARHVGELWCDDLCTFVEVTLAVGTLQKLLRTLSPLFHRTGRQGAGSRHAVLTALPGDQHTFGLAMVGEFFRRAGWTVGTVRFGAGDAFDNALRGSRCTVVGFSASTVGQLDTLAAAIRRARRSCGGGTVAVLVGGPLFVAHPEYAIRVGADALGLDADQALARAESFAVRTAGQ